ncbi:squalene synthase HpnC [Paenalcaligenes hominis]|uniref:squalene synthase HpnC n=1 Tax=Paenalcaligenes hominis TaxID=643674 RepID=UPI003523DF4F
MSVDHYENFPVASWLLPRRLRRPIQHIYWFSRSADDIADEGNHSPSWRLEQLQGYREALQHIAAGQLQLEPTDARFAIFAPLAPVIVEQQLPISLFSDLLTAFEQDVTVKRHADYEALYYYCTHSANPVGRILLHLYNEQRSDSLVMSDAICTGLQLTNFWQDIAIDWEKDRVYIPTETLTQFELSETYIADRCAHKPTSVTDNKNWLRMMQQQVEHARQLLISGMPLAARLPGRIGLELRLIILGGLRILERLDEVDYDVFNHRPQLAKADWMRLGLRLLTTQFNHKLR